MAFRVIKAVEAKEELSIFLVHPPKISCSHNLFNKCNTDKLIILQIINQVLNISASCCGTSPFNFLDGASV